VIKTTITFIFKNALLSRKNRWRRFGYASVNFGEPVSAKKYCAAQHVDFSVLAQEERFVSVEALAKSLMKNIAQVVPVLPIPLICEVLIKNKTLWKSALEIKTLCTERIKQLQEAGAPIDISSSALENVLGSAMDALIGRGLLEEKNNLYRQKDSEMEIISYYANSIVHWSAPENN